MLVKMQSSKRRTPFWKAACLATSFSLTMAPALAQAQTGIGNASKVVNQVEGSLQANVRTIATQDDVFQNEVVKTASESATQLIFKDETQLTIGPESEVTLDTFVYDSNPDKGRLVINQTVGTLRFVSGAFSDKNYEVRTPTATIGIRGTAFTVVVAANGATTVSVEAGVVSVTNVAGVTQSVSVNPGLSSTVSTPTAPPTPPGPPPPAVQTQVAQMDATVAKAPGGPAGSQAAAGTAGGGLTAGAIAAGLAIAAAVAAVAAAASYDSTAATSTTSTTSTSGTTATQ